MLAVTGDTALAGGNDPVKRGRIGLLGLNIGMAGEAVGVHPVPVKGRGVTSAAVPAQGGVRTYAAIDDARAGEGVERAGAEHTAT